MLSGSIMRKILWFLNWYDITPGVDPSSIKCLSRMFSALSVSVSLQLLFPQTPTSSSIKPYSVLYLFEDKIFFAWHLPLPTHQASLAAQTVIYLQCRQGSIPGSGRCPAEGANNPLQYSSLDKSMERGTWQATVHSIAKSQARLKWLSMHGYIIEWAYQDH